MLKVSLSFRKGKKYGWGKGGRERKVTEFWRYTEEETVERESACGFAWLHRNRERVRGREFWGKIKEETNIAFEIGGKRERQSLSVGKRERASKERERGVCDEKGRERGDDIIGILGENEEET